MHSLSFLGKREVDYKQLWREQEVGLFTFGDREGAAVAWRMELAMERERHLIWREVILLRPLLLVNLGKINAIYGPRAHVKQ